MEALSAELAAPAAAIAGEPVMLGLADQAAGEGPQLVQPTVRTQFADTAFWKGDMYLGDG
jgi:hypothetical protein